jgi:hypothetical protein
VSDEYGYHQHLHRGENHHTAKDATHQDRLGTPRDKPPPDSDHKEDAYPEWNVFAQFLVTFGDPDSFSKGLTRFFGDKRERNGYSEHDNQRHGEAFPERRTEDSNNEPQRRQGDENKHGVNDQRVNGQPTDDIKEGIHNRKSSEQTYEFLLHTTESLDS